MVRPWNRWNEIKKIAKAQKESVSKLMNNLLKKNYDIIKEKKNEP